MLVYSLSALPSAVSTDTETFTVVSRSFLRHTVPSLLPSLKVYSGCSNRTRTTVQEEDIVVSHEEGL